MVNESQLDTLRDFKKFAPKFLIIRTKSGHPRAFAFNRAQLYLHERLEAQRKSTGKVRAVILKGRQAGCCFSENMRVLTADYRWVKIADVKIGERLVACDEESPGRTKKDSKQSRKFRTAIVEDKKEFTKEAFEICFDNGARLEVTSDHRMLCKKRGGDEQQWRTVENFKIGDLVRVAMRPPNYECKTYEDGWVAGMIDGEGSARLSGAKRLSITQTNNIQLHRLKRYFHDIGIPYKECIDNRGPGINSKLGSKPCHRIDIHRMPYFMEIFARCRPIRFTTDEWYVGHELPGKAATDDLKPWTKVISIKSIGKIKVIDLQTSTKTYICEGLISHNSTYIQGRFFHQVITGRGKKAFILTHDKEATNNLFNMAKRFYENLEPGLVPKAGTENAKELYFKEFDSGYAIGTAGNKAVGRSQTIQLFHGCLAEGTMIYNASTGSLMAIEDFIVGDSIKTHTGKIASISFISSQKKECLEVTMRGLTSFSLVATPNHRFWTKNGWKRLEHFKSDDVIGYPIKEILSEIWHVKLPEAPKRSHGGGRQNKYPDEVYVDYNFGRIIGLYLAEGHIKLQSNGKRPSEVSFSIHRKEVQRTIEWIAPFSEYFSKMTVIHRENSLASIVKLNGNRFAAMINNLCGRTTGKHLPLDWNIYGEEFCRGLLHGYISGDGHSDDKCRRVRASSICSAITIPLRDLTASLGYGWASIEYKEAGIRHGRNEQERFTFSLCGDGATHLAEEIGKITPKIVNKKTKSIEQYAATTTEISGGYAWLRISDIRYAGMRQVYDFEVDHPDHSYCAIHGATHNSEIGFWQFAEDHSKGILQAISNEDGTEVILESTANGIGNYFHSRWVTAMDANNEYQAIFLPWYWQDEYTYNAANLRLTDDEDHFMSLYASNGLSKEHLAWRRMKISEFSKDFDAGKENFQIEYPFSANEAFKNPIHNVFINSKYVEKARKQRVDASGPLIIGVDVAVSDRDRSAIMRRKGRVMFGLEVFSNYNTMEIVGRIKRIIQNENPHKVYIDCIGIGAGVVDRLLEMGYTCVEGINVARSANDKEKFKNLRAELYSDLRDWLYGELPVQIPDDDNLHGELTSFGFKENSSGQIQIESKDEMRGRGLKSPDLSDSAMLTMAGGFFGKAADSPIDVPPIQPWERGMFR